MTPAIDPPINPSNQSSQVINLQIELNYLNKFKIYMILVIWHDPTHSATH